MIQFSFKTFVQSFEFVKYVVKWKR